MGGGRDRRTRRNRNLEVLVLLRQDVRSEFLRELLVDLEMFLVPVLQELVFRRHRSAELVHSVSELGRLQEQKLDDEETDLGDEDEDEDEDGDNDGDNDEDK